MSYAKSLLCIAFATFLTGCGNGDVTGKRYSEDLAVLEAKDQGVTILLKRLRENLRIEHNVIVIDGPLVNGAVALSKNSQWAISCGEGLSVDFGTNQIPLVFTLIPIDDSRCAYLTRVVGEDVQRIIEGQNRENNSN
jgi:hypothetical protein